MLLRFGGAVLGLLLLSPAALAYQVRVVAPYALLKPQPDQRSSPDIERLTPQWAQLLGTGLAADGELWCRIQSQSRRVGWIPARYLDPALANNQPLRLSDFPAPLIFDNAERSIIYKANIQDAKVRSLLRRWTFEMELAQLKKQWDSDRAQLNFLEISRRSGVAISSAEYANLQREVKLLEMKFEQILAQWSRS